jgi:hypothetical protein
MNHLCSHHVLGIRLKSISPCNIYAKLKRLASPVNKASKEDAHIESQPHIAGIKRV